MRIMIVDDQATNRELCRIMLNHVSSRIDTFATGVGIVDAMREMESLPDLVLLDVMMPEQNGFTTAQQIRTSFPDQHIAIIFLTVLDDFDSFERCLALGDDFVLKPVESSVLLAKVQAHYRIVTMHNEVMAQRDELSLFHEQVRYDYAIAESIFSNLKQEMSDQVSHVFGIDYISTPSTIFNGDLIVVANRPHGGVYVLIADATGHGLPAAISAIPATRAFFSMASKGLSLGEIASEMNEVLHRFLPTGMMLAASIFEIRASGFEVSWWGGGLPDAYILNPDGSIARKLESRHMPLGVLSSKQFESNLVHLKLAPQQRLIAYTDGVIEAANQQGEHFGPERLEQALQSGRFSIPGLYQSVREFANKNVDDDLSIISMEFPISSKKGLCDLGGEQKLTSIPVESCLSFDYNVIKSTPLMNNVRAYLSGIVLGGPHLDLICSVLSELLTNAIDHGLLEMDSKIKEQPEGFFLYYKRREELLVDLNTDAWITLKINYQPSDHSLTMIVEHNGVGFDYRNYPKTKSDATTYGRGIVLATELCDSLEYSKQGKQVTAVYRFDDAHRFPTSN